MASKWPTIEDLSNYMQKPITDLDTKQATLVLDLAVGAITADLGYDDAWADDLDPVPRALGGVCLSVAARLFDNPEGVRSTQISLGSFNESRNYTASGVALTPAESAQARRALGLGTVAAPRMESIISDLYSDFPIIPEVEIG